MYRLLPSASTLVYSSIFPIVISLYVFLDRGISATVASSEINYFTFADSKIGLIILDQSWQFWIARTLDFVLWGVIGGLFLLVFWGFSSSRIAVHNHRVQENFVNFRVPKSSWHGHFITITLVKVFIVFALLYCLVALIATALPYLIESVAAIAYAAENTSWYSLGLSFGSVIALQYLIASGIKLFRYIHVDD